MKRKKILALLMAAAMVVGLAACSGGGDADKGGDDAQTTDDGGEQTTLRIAWWGSQARHDATVEALNLYEESHPDIKFEFEYYSFDDYFTKLKTLVASDQVWDVFQLGGNFPEYMDKIHFLNEYVESGIVDTSDISDSYLKTTTDTEGNLIGLSLGVNTYGIAYDPAIFEEAGAELPTENWTWDDYNEAATKIHEELDIFGSSTFTPGSEFIAGCSVYVPQCGELGEYSFFNLAQDGMGFDDPQMLTPYIQMRADMIKEGSYPDAGATAEVTNIENDFLVTGEAGMTWVAINQFPTIYDICASEGRELKLAPLPRATEDGPSGIIPQSSQMFCVSEDSQYKEDAAEFINWFVNSEECNDILKAEIGICAAVQGAMIGLGRTKVPLVLGFLRIWLLRYIFILCTESFLAYYSVFWGNLFSNCAAAVIFLIFLAKMRWEIVK